MPESSPGLSILNSSQLDAFSRNGYLVVPGMFTTSEAETIGGWVDDIASWPERPNHVMVYGENSKLSPEQRIISRIENLTPYHKGMHDLLCHSRLSQAVSELFGESALLFKDKINFKLPGGEGYQPHQDVQAGWDVYGSLHITAMLAIDPATHENGCLEVVAGRHREGLIGELWKPLSQQQIEDMSFEPVICLPGDVVLFDSFAPHRSAPNLSQRPRRILYATYNRQQEGDHLQQYYADKRTSYPPDCERDPNKDYRYRV